MSYQMENLENEQNRLSRWAEREKDLTDAIAALQIENDRLRAENRMLNDGSCVERLQNQLRDAQEAAKILFDRTSELVKENERLAGEQQQLEKSVNNLWYQRRQDAKYAIEHDTRHHEMCNILTSILDAWRDTAMPASVEVPRLDLVRQWLDNKTREIGYLSTYSDETLRFPDDDIPF